MVRELGGMLERKAACSLIVGPWAPGVSLLLLVALVLALVIVGWVYRPVGCSTVEAGFEVVAGESVDGVVPS